MEHRDLMAQPPATHLPEDPAAEELSAGTAPLDDLKRSITSVLDQYYPHWQLCVCDRSDGDPRLREIASLLAAIFGGILCLALSRLGRLRRSALDALARARISRPYGIEIPALGCGTGRLRAE